MDTESNMHGTRGFKTAKDKKGSLRNKYKRRVRGLAYTLDDLISHAEDRLDINIAGRIHHRADAEKFLKECRKLRKLIPVKRLQDEEPSEEVMRQLDRVFENLATNPNAYSFSPSALPP